MWSDGRGRYYEVFPSGEQVFGVRTSDVSGRVVRSTKHLIRREARTGKFLWQGGRRTFELETHRAPEQLAWRCRSGGRDFTWKLISPPSEESWPYPLKPPLSERARTQEVGEALLNSAVRWPNIALCERSRKIQERVDARLTCRSLALEWLDEGRQLKEASGGCASEASSADHAVLRFGAHGVAYVDLFY